MIKICLLTFIVAAVVLLASYADAFGQARVASERSLLPMVGFVPIIIYLLCISIIYKAFEIYQIALMSNSKNKNSGIIIGAIAIGISVVITIIIDSMVRSQTEAAMEVFNSLTKP